MLESKYPRDLVMIGAVFGVAAFVWADWAQESPPTLWVWPVTLGVLAVAGLALAVPSILIAVRNWRSPTAIQGGTIALTVYLIVFWAEVVVAGVLAFFAIQGGHSDLIAPLILAAVGVHFFALTPVFSQPVLSVVAGLLVAAAILAGLIPGGDVARSFWCGIIAGPVFLAIGIWCLVAGRMVLREA